MRRPQAIVLVALAAPLLTLMQVDLSGCLSGGGDGGGGLIFNLPPTVVLSADVVRGIAPLTARFSSVGSSDDGLIVARLWNFGDGQTSPDISPTHTFNETGSYTVRLTLTDDENARASRTIVISVTRAPIARIQVDRTTAPSAPATFNFDASDSSDPDGTIDRYSWDFGDGSRETLPVVPHTYASPGTYRVQLTVTDDTGVTASAEAVIEVGIPTPDVQFRAPRPAISHVVCSQDSKLWTHVVFNAEPAVPRTITAGLDGDNDPCGAQALLFDRASAEALRAFLGHTGQVRAAVYSPDGSLVLTASADRTLRLHNTASGDLIRSYSGPAGALTSVAFAPDGAAFVAGDDTGRAYIRGTFTSGIVEIVAHTGAVNGVAFSPNDDQVLTGGADRLAKLWATDGSAIRTFDGHTDEVTAVAFSPDDPELILLGSADDTATLWNTSTGTLLARFTGHGDDLTSVAFAPDGAQVLTGSADGTAKLWNATGGAAVRTFTGHSGDVTAVAFAPNGTQVATGGADGTVRVWNSATGGQANLFQPVRVIEESGNQQFTTRSCTSAIQSVAFAPDGETLLAAVGALNDIRLDTTPRQGNDLNLTVPTPLDLTRVPEGEYRLWVEIDTDRTEPSRTYSHVIVNVIAAFTQAIEFIDDTPLTPRIPLREQTISGTDYEVASVLVAPTTRRQIFDLGPLNTGDRLFISLLTLPGYSQAFSSDSFSVLLLDTNEEMFAWYQNDYVLFTPFSRLVAGHASPNHYVVIDSGTSVDLRIERDAGLFLRPQRIFLNFAGGSGVAVADLPPSDIPAFDANDLNSSWGAAETVIMKNRIVQTVRDFYAPWNVLVFTSDDGTPPTPPYQTMYFQPLIESLETLFLFGIADYIDPRNETLTGNGLVATRILRLVFPALSADGLGRAIGTVAVHEAGHLLGLRHTDGETDIMGLGIDPTSPLLQFTVAPLAALEQDNTPIGLQDAPQLFDEILGRVEP